MTAPEPPIVAPLSTATPGPATRALRPWIDERLRLSVFRYRVPAHANTSWPARKERQP